MKLTVHLHTTLARPTPQGLQSVFALELSEGLRLGELVLMLEVKLPLEALLLVVNGRHAGEEQVLAEGDEVHIIPALEGGNGVRITGFCLRTN